MNWILGICILLLLVLEMIQSLKMRRLTKALTETNRALNETRDVVAKHDKLIKRHLPYQNR